MPRLPPVGSPSVLVGGSVGDMLPDPFDQLRMRSVEMDRMVDELFSSSFFVVASSAMALTPFSQYSAMPDRSSSGSGQAQPGQS